MKNGATVVVIEEYGHWIGVITGAACSRHPYSFAVVTRYTVDWIYGCPSRVLSGSKMLWDVDELQVYDRAL